MATDGKDQKESNVTDINISEEMKMDQFLVKKSQKNSPELLREPPDLNLGKSNAVVKSKTDKKLFKRVYIMKLGRKTVESDGILVVFNFPDALNRVEPGGTITVFPGLYRICEPLVIDRPVIIEGKKGSRLKILNGANITFSISDENVGDVTINNLKFENSAWFD